MDSLGAAKAHGFHLTIDCDVGPANLQNLGCRLHNGQSEELLHQVSVVQGSNKSVLYIPQPPQQVDALETLTDLSSRQDLIDAYPDCFEGIG